MQYARGRLDVMPREAHARPPARSLSLTANTILGLQQTAGNAAVQRLIQVQRETEREQARDRRLVTAITDADWAGVATVLLPSDEKWMVQRLHNLTASQLRYLDDAVRRMGVLNSRLRMFIHAGLEQLGATPDTAAVGAGFGDIEGHATKITNGKVQAGGNQTASYRFEVTFMPRAGAVDATLIEFIQMAKVVSTVNSTPDPVGQANPQNAGANGAARQEADHSRIDIATGRNQGWIGSGNDGKPIKDRLRPWQPGSTVPAWMSDTPSRSVPNVDFTYETAAICRQGKDQGTVYATVRWGFTIDAAMQVIPKEPVYFNKESTEFDLAIAFWNTEAATAGNTEQPLPENLH